MAVAACHWYCSNKQQPPARQTHTHTLVHLATLALNHGIDYPIPLATPSPLTTHCTGATHLTVCPSVSYFITAAAVVGVSVGIGVSFSAGVSSGQVSGVLAK